MSEQTTEKRTAPRHRVLKGGMIAFDGAGIACTVRNLSSTGAGLEISSHALNLPPSFTLLIESDQFIRRCHPVWRKDKRIGVAFEQFGDCNGGSFDGHAKRCA
jgi:PilZ domain